jgi:hypothetical protein
VLPKTNSQMKKLSQLLIVLYFASFASCIDMGKRVNGNGHVTTETRSVNSTNRIRMFGSMDVIIDNGPSAVKVEADENIIPYIITDVRDGWLEIRTENHVNLNTHNGIKVYVSTPSLDGIVLSGSGNVNGTKTFFTSNKAAFKVSGSGDIRCDINAPQVDARITGSGNIILGGETKDVDVHITGGGDYEGSNLKAENASVNITGSGDVNLFADASLNVKVTGSGSVKYKGNATVNQKIIGSGSVQKMQ